LEKRSVHVKFTASISEKEVKEMKKVLPVLVLGVVGMVFVGAYLLYSSKKGTAVGVEKTGEVNKEQQEEGFVGKLSDVFNRGVSVSCTYEDEAGKGSLWAKEDKAYMEQVSADGKEGYFLVRDNCTYIWGDEMNGQGMKVCYTPEEGEESATWGYEEGSEQAAWTGYQYNCKPEVVSESKFDIPTNITFLDLEEGIMELFNPEM
jgi:hypothetical protein